MICLYVISLVYYYKGLYLLYIVSLRIQFIFTIIIYVHFRPEFIITTIEEMNIYLSKLFLNLFFSSLCVWSWHPATNNWNPFYYLFKVSLLQVSYIISTSLSLWRNRKHFKSSWLSSCDKLSSLKNRKINQNKFYWNTQKHFYYYSGNKKKRSLDEKTNCNNYFYCDLRFIQVLSLTFRYLKNP